MTRINYAKLEEIGLQRWGYFKDELSNSFEQWANKHCKKFRDGHFQDNCHHPDNLKSFCLRSFCPRIEQWKHSLYYKNLFAAMPEYKLMKLKKRGRIYEETIEGITRQVNSARKEHRCDWCGKTIRIGSPYLVTIDFHERRVLKSCDDCHKSIIWMYGD